MSEHFFAAIMAGGGGTRLWPLSRRSRPKQSLALFGEKTLFQVAVDRIRPLIPTERIFVMTGEDQADLLKRQSPEIPKDNFLLEPSARGTACAIGYAAICIENIDPEGVMACLTADHFIRGEDEFRATLAAAMNGALSGGLFTLGIPPSSADTSYGYIHKGDPAGVFNGFQSFHVQAFTEKPDFARAGAYVSSGEYLWNSGMFIWKSTEILAEMKRQLPELHDGLRRIQNDSATPSARDTLQEEWGAFDAITIDYGVMEGAREVYVLPADDLGWVDVGDWARLFQILAGSERDVVNDGPDMVLDSHGLMIARSKEIDPEKLVAAIDVEDLVVIETPDVLLICKRQSAQRVRTIVEQLKSEGMDRYL